MITIYRSQGNGTEVVDGIDPAWLAPGSGVWLWVDLSDPSGEELQVLRSVFRFHELAVEDAMTEAHQPKIESTVTTST